MNTISDKKDELIVKAVEENPGIRIFELTRKTGMPYSTVRYRVFDMERRKALKITCERGSVHVYLIDENPAGV